MKHLLVLSIGLLITTILSAQKRDTISVFFEHDNRTTFSPTDLKFKNDHIIKSQISIVGYTDHLGSEDYNKRLSLDRANCVADHIKSNWESTANISTIEGLGEITTISNSDNQGDAQNRRVDIILIDEPIKNKTNQKSKAIIQIPALDEPLALDIDTSTAANIVLEGVEFIPGRHYPLPESREKLDQLSVTMKKYETLVIEIQGFICCDYSQFDGLDNDTQTMNLSENRAKFIYDFLIRVGIDEDRLSYKGYGSSKPKVFPENTEDDRQANRRVEIRIIK